VHATFVTSGNAKPGKVATRTLLADLNFMVTPCPHFPEMVIAIGIGISPQSMLRVSLPLRT
jgi:hypothetical protein